MRRKIAALASSVRPAQEGVTQGHEQRDGDEEHVEGKHGALLHVARNFDDARNQRFSVLQDATQPIGQNFCWSGH